MLNKLVIINNEKVFSEKNLFYCDNIEMKSLPEGLGKNFDISMILRKSKIQRSHQIKINKINLSSNIFNFLLNIFKTFKNKETNYLLISITPYTFLAHFILLIFKRKIFLYLRSNGHEEYKAIFGFIGPLLYHFMYIFVTFRSKIIVCQNKITNKKKVDLVYPSQLDKSWLINTTTAPMDKPRLLYVGRIKVEKGIFSLIKILENTSFNFELTIVGKPSNLKLNNSKIKYIGYENNPEKLRKIYDSHNIFILPSFTEAHPQALDESLARQRPAIIFEEISHVIQNKKGVFVTKRKTENLIQTINFIMNNYKNIIQSIKKNDLPSKEKFIEQMKDILNRN
tara:strand:- start:17434 stop:18450 length:1017 start_codon:yes stop_codon:yes gene_type:complete